jgi:hypothetical protein
MRLVYVGESNEEYVCSDEDMEKELNYLKEKCDAGGTVIITQLFYDYDVFKHWVGCVRAKGITAPILPGIMPLNVYKGFKNMTSESWARGSGCGGMYRVGFRASGESGELGGREAGLWN